MRLEEKLNKENIEKKVPRLTGTKNKFSLLKDEIPNTTIKEVFSPGEQISSCMTSQRKSKSYTSELWKQKR